MAKTSLNVLPTTAPHPKILSVVFNSSFIENEKVETVYSLSREEDFVNARWDCMADPAFWAEVSFNSNEIEKTISLRGRPRPYDVEIKGIKKGVASTKIHWSAKSDPKFWAEAIIFHEE